MKKYQIGVMGSCSDLKYSKTIQKSAEKLGYLIAKNGAILFFGAEKDIDSLSAAACRGAKRAGGLTVGVTYGKKEPVYEVSPNIVIASGLERGGGREMTLVLSCDAIVTIGGGSGTLTEIAIAYQANIPIIALKQSGGWSDKLVNKYLDERNRLKIIGASSPTDAILKLKKVLTW
jgi:uncharacterized protein (TIGR00725 family)